MFFKQNEKNLIFKDKIRVIFLLMATINLEIFYRDTVFSSLIASHQMAVINIVYSLLRERRLDDFAVRSFCARSGMHPAAFHRNKNKIIDCALSLIPTVAKDKRVRVDHHKLMLSGRKPAKRREKLDRLAPAIPENPAPLMPQLSAQSEKITRQLANAYPTAQRPQVNHQQKTLQKITEKMPIEPNQ